MNTYILALVVQLLTAQVGASHTTYSYVDTDSTNCDGTCSRYVALQSDAAAGTIYAPSFQVERPLHDIEIRTKRTLREIGPDCNYCSDADGLWACTAMGCTLPSTKECKGNEQFSTREIDETWGERKVSRTHFYCEHITKTLYIDGQRWGVIRETEDK